MGKIITGSDVAKSLRLHDFRTMIRAQSNSEPYRKMFKGGWNGRDNKHAKPVYARIDNGRWMADCECGGAEYVDPADPIFYCFSCGNLDYDRYSRPVIFPDRRIEIEELLLKRPMKTTRRGNIVIETMSQKPAIGRLGWDWTPGETVDMLKLQNKGLK